MIPSRPYILILAASAVLLLGLPSHPASPALALMPDATTDSTRFAGLRTTIYVADDLDRAKAWYAEAFGVQPYFDEPFYVGFNVGGYELGLLPAEDDTQPGPGGTLTYWGVEDVEETLQHLVELGATIRDPAQDVGDGVVTATVQDPFGNIIGVIRNPHFSLPSAE